RHASAREHRDEKPDEDGLAGSGRPADERVARVFATAAVRVAGIARMEVEVERRPRPGDEGCDRLTPVVPRGTAGRVIVKGRHGREVARGDRGFARPVREVSG